ncbi:PLAT/LH2 domain-containing protein [Oricola sp.]|uniref:PLAT/LH2 domain-containing protein n=1 Tax=Oricola sp. TaxID=1979950 RepID=UPI0025E4759E|nr:PLAT/LH2 domain-containing protein [Oricola sp.]MCI5073723.1 hypothetical protein [Oricola sp.]
MAGLLLAGAATTGLVSATDGAQAQSIVNYCVMAKTGDVTRGGTDNTFDITLYGRTGKSRPYRLQGDSERNEYEPTPIATSDIGVITRIAIDGTSGLADDWYVAFVRVYRDATCDNVTVADGWSEFIINDWVEGGGDVKYANATKIVEPRVELLPSGEVSYNPEYLTIVNYADVRGPTQQTVMNFQETWSTVKEVQVSKEDVQSVGMGASVTWESPETVAGTFGAEVSTSWENIVAKARSESTQNMSESTYDWSYTAPGNTFVFRKTTFEVPYRDELIKASDGSRQFLVRKIGGRITPVSNAGSFLEIPLRRGEEIIQVGTQELETEWFAYLRQQDANQLRTSYLPYWKSQGWVVEGAGGGRFGVVAPAAPSAPAAPAQPNAPMTAACRDSVDGKVAYDYNGNNVWNPANIDALCGASPNVEPVTCFQQVMFGGVDWGGGTQWAWANALNLCAGTSNAAGRVNCFKQNVGAQGWAEAINNCSRQP